MTGTRWITERDKETFNLRETKCPVTTATQPEHISFFSFLVQGVQKDLKKKKSFGEGK